MNPIKLFFYRYWDRIEGYLTLVSILIILFFAFKHRLQFIDQESKDIYAYERAISDLISGENPYKWTVASFNNPDDPTNHGYSYFPGLLYIFTPLYIISLNTHIPQHILWKIPVLLADLGVGILLYKFFKNKGLLAITTALLIWFFNPYSFFRSGYTYTDPITIFFMFASIMLLEKDDVAAGALYGLSIAFKTFPFIIFPVMIIKSKHKFKFLLAGAVVGLMVSLPFLTNWQDFLTYLNGTLLVHQNRYIQGRPFLFYISYFYSVELFQIIPFGFYTLMASFSGWVLSSAAYLFKWVKDKYILALIPFLTFYIFTPVFNRTYFMWFIPIYTTACYQIFKNKYRALFYISQLIFFAFAGWYLLQWEDGFHIWHP